jgi:site-specific DNA-methyltransferase (adenine-specific)
MTYTLLHGDCLERMRLIENNSVDLVLCDLPYGITSAPWDIPIDLNKLWEQYHRIVKKNGTVILFSAPPFNADLITSNKAEFSHSLYWVKNAPTGFLNSKNQPVKNVEEIIVFRINNANRHNKGRYNAVRDYFYNELRRSGLTRAYIDKLLNNFMSSHYFTHGEQFALPTEDNYKKLQTTGYWLKPYSEVKALYDSERVVNSYTYNPQGLKPLDKPKYRDMKKPSDIYRGLFAKPHTQTVGNYPRQTLEFNCATNKLHPTEKPVALLEYLINTYSNAGEIVLDNTMGSGSTGIACMNTNREFIGIEKDEKFFEIADIRIQEANK